MIETCAVRSDSSLTSRVHQRPRRMSDLKNTENTCTTDEQHQQQHHQQSAALTRFAPDKQQHHHHQQGGNSSSKLGHGGEELLLCGRSNDDTLSTVVTTTTGSSSISREPHFLWIPQPPSFGSVSVSQQKSGCSSTDPINNNHHHAPPSSVLLGNKCSGAAASSVANVDESSSKSPSVVVSSSSIALNSTELLLQQRQQQPPPTGGVALLGSSSSYSSSSNSVIVREATHGSAVSSGAAVPVGDKAASSGGVPLSSVEIVRCELLWGAGGHQNQRHHEFVGFTPVEGCEIQPLVLLRDWNGRLFDDDEIEAKHHHHPHIDIQVHYRWLCGPPRAVCYFHTHKEAIYQCSGTLRCFCSYGCFLRGQKQLRKFYNSGGQYAIALHPNPHTYGVPCAKFPWDNYDSIREVDDRHFKLLKQASLLIDPRLSNWKAVSLTRNFIPTAAEVGRQLKFQCAICVTRRDHAEPSPTQPPPPEDAGPTQEDQTGRPSSSLYNNGYNGQQTQGGSSSLGGGGCSSEDEDDQPPSTSKTHQQQHHRISSPNNNNHLNYRSDEQSSRSFEDYCSSSSSNNVQQQPSPTSPQLQQQQQQQYYHLSHGSNSSSAAVRTQSLPHQPPGTHNIKHHPPIISSSSFRFGTNKPPLNPASPMPASLKPPPHTTSVEQEVDFWVEWDQMEKERQQNVEKGTSSSSPHADSNIVVIHETGTQLTRSVTTACVVPQMPLAAKRDFLPVGMLAMFSRGGTPSTRFQRLRVAGRLVTEILGSKQATFLANQANPSGIIRKSFEASSRFAQTPEGGVLNLRNAGIGSASSRRVRDKLTEEERAIIEATREDFLTEGYMAVRQALAQQELSLHQAQAAAASSMNAARSVRRTANENNVVSSSSASGGGSVSDVWMSGGKPSSLNPSGGTDSSDVSLMSWNVLAEIYATTEAFPYCDPYVLAWSYRRTRLLNEIISIAPDIVCLQEVQAEHFEDFFAPAMAEHGYEGLYKQKTVEIFTGTGKRTGGKFTCDGCATFFKVSKFRLVDNFGIEFSHLIESSVRQAPTFDNQNQQHKALRRLLKDNVALVLLLELQDSVPRTSDQIRGEKNSNNNCESITGIASPYPRRQLTVVNTHIVANPESPDVKLWQAQTLLNVVQDYMHEVALHNEFEYTRVYGPGRREPPPVGLVISGDFNSPPTSAVYELVTAGRCDLRHEEFSADRSNLLSGLAIGHRLQLRSAYGVAHMLRMEAERALQISGSASSSSTGNTTVLPIHNYEPEFTNYTRDFIGCLDYIFFNDAMRITGSLDLLTELTLIEEAHNLQLADWALPSPLRPSDHIPLVAKFVWNDSNPLIPKQTNKQ